MKGTKYKIYTKRKKSYGNIIVLVLLCIIIILSSFVVISAYWNYLAKNRQIEHRIVNIHNSLQNRSDPNEFKATCNWLIERLESYTDAGLQANTISFLFSIFSVALISAGAYILEKSRENIRASESAVKQIRENVDDIEKRTDVLSKKVKIFDDRLDAWEISESLSSATHMSWRLRELEQGPAFDALIPYERDLLSSIECDLTTAVQKDLQLVGTQTTRLLEQALNIQTNLQSLPGQSKSKTIDLIDHIENILALTKELRSIVQ